MSKLLDFLTELMAWFQIVLSPLLIGLALGAIIYFNKQDQIGLILGSSVAALGLIVGVIWATSVWKKKGTQNFLSVLNSTPDIDHFSDEQKNDKKREA